MNAENLIYPIPPSHGLGLGVHLTLDVGGGQKFGSPIQKKFYLLITHLMNI